MVYRCAAGTKRGNLRHGVGVSQRWRVGNRYLPACVGVLGHEPAAEADLRRMVGDGSFDRAVNPEVARHDAAF